MSQESVVFHTENGTKYIFNSEEIIQVTNKSVQKLRQANYLSDEHINKIIKNQKKMKKSWYNRIFDKHWCDSEGGRMLYEDKNGRYLISSSVIKREPDFDEYLFRPKKDDLDDLISFASEEIIEEKDTDLEREK